MTTTSTLKILLPIPLVFNYHGLDALTPKWRVLSYDKVFIELGAETDTQTFLRLFIALGKQAREKKKDIMLTDIVDSDFPT